MKKVLIVFRGLNYRIRSDKHGVTHTISALDGIENWKKSIFEDLIINDISYDIALITYNSIILNELINLLNPKYIITEGFNSQIENINKVGDLIVSLSSEYDRFVICRFDYRYKYKISSWPSWNKKGIIITNPDPCGGLFSDILFVVDSNLVSIWNEAAKSITMWPHQIGQYLVNSNTPFHLMYTDPFGSADHPLYSYISIEEDAIL